MVNKPNTLLLHTLLDQSRGKRFVWGENDCMLFTARIADKVGVFDSSEIMGYAGTYKNKREARELIGKFGGFEKAADYFFRSLKTINTRKACHGDIVLVDGPHGLSVAICAGSVAAGPGDNGIEFISMKKAKKSWAN